MPDALPWASLAMPSFQDCGLCSRSVERIDYHTAKLEEERRASPGEP